MSNPLIVIPIWAAILLISAGLGRRLLALMKVKAQTSLEATIFGLGLGLGTLAYLVLSIGLLGWLYTWTILMLLGVTALVSAREIGAVVTEIIAGLRGRASTRLSAWHSIVGFSMVALGALALMRALAPSTRMDWDGLAYHLAVPRLYLLSHSIHYIPFVSHSNFPFLTEMLYTIGLAIDSVQVAKLFHFWMYIGTAIAIYSLCARHLSAKVGGLGALVFMSMPVVLWEAGLAYADLSTAFYVTLGIYALLNWEQTRATPWLALSGVMCGFALGTKVLAGVVIGAMCLWTLWIHVSSHEWRRGLGAALMLGIVAALVGAPWYIKSYAYTGNPFYPFLYNIFGGLNWSREAADAYRQSQVVFGMGRGLADLIAVPWNLTMYAGSFFDKGLSPAQGSIGFLLLALIPLQLLVGKSGRAIRLMGFLSAVYLVAWFYLMQQSRYLIGVLPATAIIAASGGTAVLERWRTGRLVVYGVVGLAVAMSLVVGLLSSLSGVSVVMGRESAEEYLSRSLDVYDAEQYINTSLPSDVRVVLFNEVLGFYLDRPYMWGDPNHHALTPWDRIKTGRDLVEHFRSQGYTHALVNWNWASDDRLNEVLLMQSIGEGRMQEIYAQHGVSVYEFADGWQP